MKELRQLSGIPEGALVAHPVTGAAPIVGRLPIGFAIGLLLVTFGVWIALFTPAMVGLALKLQHMFPDDPAAAPAYLGIAASASGFAALLTNPLFGRLSDRTMSRFGRRRPWILAGALVTVAAYGVVGWTDSIAVLIVAYIIASIAANAVLAAANASLPDQVPHNQRGKVSGWVGITLPAAILAGVFLMGYIPGEELRFLIPSLVLLVTAVMFVVILKDDVVLTEKRAPFTAAQFFSSFVFNPRTHRNFGWVWLTKFLILFGYSGVGTYLPFLLLQKFQLSEQDTISTILQANVASMVLMLVSGPIGGWISDRIGRRVPNVAVASFVMVIGILMLGFAGSVPMVIIAQGIIGFGFGAFLSVDLALATTVLPNPDDMGKDLGVLNIASALPGSIAPALAPAILALGNLTPLGGYTMWYIVGAAVALTGGALIFRIKDVK